MKYFNISRHKYLFAFLIVCVSTGTLWSQEIHNIKTDGNVTIKVQVTEEKTETPVAEPKVPLFNLAKTIVQPVLGAAFVIPWIVYFANPSRKSDKFFSKDEETALYVTTPVAMAFTLTLTGWLMDGGSYNFFASFGIASGLSSLGAMVSFLISAIYVAAPGGSLRAFYLTTTTLGGILGIVASMGGDVLGKLLTRKYLRDMQPALVSGRDGKISFGIPVPMIYTKPVNERKLENYFGVSLVYYRF